MGIVDNVLMGASGNQGYNLQRSLRFRSSASAYLSRTPAVAGNRQKYTWSGWVKRGSLTSGGTFTLFGAGTTSPDYDAVRFSSDNLQFFQGGAVSVNIVTTQVFRDPAAWYHIVLAVDTTQATAANRVIMYVNGSQITSYSTANYPAQNASAAINNTYATGVAAGYVNGAYGLPFDGYIAELNFIDGQSLTPSSFGSTNAVTGVWQPKKYAGTYGTNGFYLPFTTNSLNTLLSTSANISAPFGGVATNALVADGVYCTSNTSLGSSFTFILNDFGTATQVTRYVIANLYFTGGTSTFSIQGSPDNSTWTTLATLSTTGSPQNFSGSLNGNFRYWRIAPTSFGTNGQANVDQCVFYQDGLGLDFSGNGNNWTPNNISVTAGATYDSMTDVPTLTSTTAANYAVVSPIDTVGTGTIADGNLKLTGGSAAWLTSRTGFGMTTGKWYWETTILSANTASNGIVIGISSSGTQAAGYGSANNWGYNNNTGGTGRKNLNGVSSAYGVTYVAGNVVGVAFDADLGSIICYVNNASQDIMVSSGLPNPAFPSTSCYGTDSVAVNFGQQPFVYTPPTGYLPLKLNTYNI